VTVDAGGRDFLLQTLFLLLRILLFGGAIVFMGPANSDPAGDQVATLTTTVQQQNDAIVRLSLRVDDLVSMEGPAHAVP
jgi:hypothetical protein